MADLEQTIYYILTQDSTVNGLIGNRVYPLKAPDRPTFPFVVYQRLTTTIQATLDPSINPNFAIVTLWVTVFGSRADGFGNWKALSAAVKAALHMKRGTFNGTLVHSILLENLTDEYLDEVEIYRSLQTYQIMINE